MRIDSKKELELQDKYKGLGYSVMLNPSREKLPFDLGDYIPDLVCIKGDETLIIEIKSGHWRHDLEKYKEIARRVSEHKYAKFLIIQSESDAKQLNASEVNFDTSNAIEKIKKLINLGINDAALFFAWNLVVNNLRKLLINEFNIDAKINDKVLINQLYSDGVISMDLYDKLIYFMRMRNEVAHSINLEISKEIPQELLEIAMAIGDMA
ncbi:hypothetical protein H9X98_03885 [Aeromonas jandaei]|uniref:hypothetical protein n=1 Tax=Aeromonas jandaei TaxID=650 RepID=UPI001F43FC37|nr:hypothetical protein [Aeromonas jandaei]